MSEGSSGRRTLKWMFIAVLAVFFILVIADSMGAFSDSPYTAVPHGDHVHYVPNECEEFSINDFPVVAPAEDERILCDGRVVPAEQAEQIQR